MKRKNLEKAVLLTVMVMSLHGAAYAENPVKADGTQETITTTTGQDSTILINDTTQVGLTAVNGGSVTVDGNGKLIIDKNAFLSVLIVSMKQMTLMLQMLAAAH